MKKTFLFVIFLVSILDGCSNAYILLSGESKHWTGKYSANIDGNNENGIYEFHFKNEKSQTNFKTLEIVINKNNGGTSKKEENYKGATITISSACSGCAVTSKNEPIKVTIKWNGSNSETFYLKTTK